MLIIAEPDAADSVWADIRPYELFQDEEPGPALNKQVLLLRVVVMAMYFH